ncbi:MAG: hypothetical protein JXA44_06790 [Methanospirillaceae archaeon]|nr:hypothetical protein [Methanospirillaceae archaeon]
MIRTIPSPHSASSGVGSLPHTDPKEACDLVLAFQPEYPTAPTLPARTPYEAIITRDAEYLPGGVLKGNSLHLDRSIDFSLAMEQIYLDFMEGNYENHAPSHEGYAGGYHELAGRDLSGVVCTKVQVTGPVTFGLTITDGDRRPIAYDAQYFDMLSKMLALRARWYESLIGKTGTPDTLVIIDEPYFAALGSSVMQVDNGMVEASFEDFSSLIQGGIGFHCCSNTDWGFLISLGPSCISFDAYAYATEFLLYKDDIVSYLEQGGVVAWGIVPAEVDKFEKESTSSLFERYLAIRTALSEYIPVDLFDAQAMITPSCGLRLADVSSSVAITKTVAEITGMVRAL